MFFSKTIWPVLLFHPSQAPPPAPCLHACPQIITCPIGGEKFEALAAGASHISYGSRPDGVSYGIGAVPVPECPGNGLVLFDDFDAAAIERLAPLIASPEYRKFAEQDSTYYRAQWLATRIGRPETEALTLLLRATWQAKEKDLPGEADKVRDYQQEFIRRVRALPEDPKDELFIGLHARAANALREIGRFEDAAAMLSRLDGWVGPQHLPDWQEFVDSMRPIVARRDASIEPLDRIPPRMAAYECTEPKRSLSAFEQRFCAGPALAEHMARAQKFRALNRCMDEHRDEIRRENDETARTALVGRLLETCRRQD